MSKTKGLGGAIKRRYKKVKKNIVTPIRKMANSGHNLLKRSKSFFSKIKMKFISSAEMSGIKRKGGTIKRKKLIISGDGGLQ